MEPNGLVKVLHLSDRHNKDATCAKKLEQLPARGVDTSSRRQRTDALILQLAPKCKLIGDIRHAHVCGVHGVAPFCAKRSDNPSELIPRSQHVKVDYRVRLYSQLS